jgi:glycosyltransferase involved in cell wall biosynthesis
MKLVYITDQIYLHGGAEKILIQKLNHWVEDYNYDVVVITTAQKNKLPFFPLNSKVKLIDLGIDYNESISYFTHENRSKFFNHYKKLKKIIEIENPTAVFVVSLGLARYITPFITKKSISFFEYHTSYYGTFLSYQKKTALKKLFYKIKKIGIKFIEDKYNYVVLLNQEEYDFFKRKNGIIIPNFFNESDKPLVAEKENKIIALGRLTYQKGFDLLLEAWKIASKKISGWRIEVYGNGEDKDQLQDLIVTNNLSDSFFLLPATNQVNQLMATSSIYVMSSRYETFPMVLLEALQNGLPVVSFECPSGARAILTNNSDSIIVKNDDVNQLAEGLLTLMNDEKRRNELSKNAIQNVKRFSPKIVMETWNRFITNPK